MMNDESVIHHSAFIIHHFLRDCVRAAGLEMLVGARVAARAAALVVGDVGFVNEVTLAAAGDRGLAGFGGLARIVLDVRGGAGGSMARFG